MALTKKEVKEQLETLGVEFDHNAPVAELRKLLSNQPTTAETDVTEAAVDSAKQEAEVITEKRSAESTEAVAKAGKRSSKALKEAAEKEAKKERKTSGDVAEAKPKQPVKPARSRLERRGKQFRKSAEKIEKDKLYTLDQAVKLAKETSHVKFDATVELHINLSVDPRQADQNIRDTLVLPAGTGKTLKVAVANDELLAQIDKNIIDFDVLVATPDFMPKLGKYARTLGPRGLMPNPKSGTVTTDVDRAVAEAKAGRVEYRVDSTGIIHLGVGKVSFDAPKLLENIQAVFASLRANKPNSIKGAFMQAVYLTTTMGPSIKVDIASLG